FATIYRSFTRKKVLSKNSSKNGTASGNTFNTRNIDPTITNGIDAIPAAMIARTKRQDAITRIGRIKYYSKIANTLLLFSAFRWEEQTSELKSRFDIVCRLLPQKKTTHDSIS